MIGLGNHPFVSFPFTQNYELAHLTVRAGPNTTPQGVATGWTQKVKLHHLEIIGFSSGITVDLSLDDSIHDVFIQGTGATTGRCIRFRELDLFRNQLPGGHMTGHQVHHNVLQDCLTGIDLTNTVETAVHTNRIERIRNGIRLAGVGQPEVQNNFITQSDFAGILLLNVDGSSIHHNTFCSSTAAVRYNQSANDLFGFAPSSNNTIFQNTFGPNSLGIVFADSLLGQGNTNFKNVIRSGACQ